MPDRTEPPGALAALSDRLRAMPLLRALVPMIAGVVAGTYLPQVPLFLWVIAAVGYALTAGLAAEYRRRHPDSDTPDSLPPDSRRDTRPKLPAPAAIYTALAIVFLGAALARLHTPRPVTPQGERIELTVRLTDNPSYRGRSGHTSGIVIPTGEKLLVSFDTMYRLGAGDRVTFRGYVNPVSDSATSYSRLMRARGYVGRTYISQYSRPTVAPAAKTHSLAALAKKMQSAATARLHRLGADRQPADSTPTVGSAATPGKVPAIGDALNDALAVATAMTTGERTGITPELRKNYSHTGASHLLAVSGLHVGIVFLIINILLYLLPLFRGGHIVKNIVAAASIWLYAALTGLSPSATRAAFMFTGAQTALAMSRTRSAANIMCGTALVMLAVRPGLVFDISFQLSFIAVAAILAWFSPLYRLVESRYKGLNALWATLIVGLVASTATMPLVSHTFGVFSPAGIVLNPIVILTAHLVVVFSLVWIVAPVPLLEPVFRWLVAGPAWLQNRVVGLVAEVPGVAVEWTMPLWMVFVVYAAMIIFTAWVATRPQKVEPFILHK